MADHTWVDEAAFLQAAALLNFIANFGWERPRTVCFEMPCASHGEGGGRQEREDSQPSHNERAGQHPAIRDTNTINELYERYLRSNPPIGTEAGRSSVGLDLDDLVEITDLSVLRPGCSKPVAQSSSGGVEGLPETSIPSDATATLFVEGLPASCTRREVSHIFRPFHGYKEVRVVMQEPRRLGGDPLVLCFVDFDSANHAAKAKDALQGYNFDENNRDSGCLRLHFSHSRGAKSGFENPARQ